jgi:hypothetical protein
MKTPSALRRGTQGADRASYVRSVKEAEGGAWNSQECEELMNLSRSDLKQLRDSFAIVYWTDDRGDCSYPKWQCDTKHRVLEPVREILHLLRTHDTLKVLTTFLVPAVGDAGESPLHLIQEGRSAEAIAFVRGIVEER